MKSHIMSQNMPQRSNRKHALPALLEYALLTTVNHKSVIKLF